MLGPRIAQQPALERVRVQAHAADERYSVRDGINIARYAIKLKSLATDRSHETAALETARLPQSAHLLLEGGDDGFQVGLFVVGREETMAACAANPWKCPNDSANWIASANSASREPVLMLFRNHFTSVYALPRRPSLDHPLLHYNIGGG